MKEECYEVQTYLIIFILPYKEQRNNCKKPGVEKISLH